jgi:hypothetical protein
MFHESHRSKRTKRICLNAIKTSRYERGGIGKLAGRLGVLEGDCEFARRAVSDREHGALDDFVLLGRKAAIAINNPRLVQWREGVSRFVPKGPNGNVAAVLRRSPTGARASRDGWDSYDYCRTKS